MPQNHQPFALLSVSDKTGILAFAKQLVSLGFGIISTGGTAQHLRDGGVKVSSVSEITGVDELFDGRVKTLHPKIHGALLADRNNPAHRAELTELGFPDIQVVVVNLYPFASAVSNDNSWANAVENIDIGGPTMLRAAAKNHQSITVVVDPDDFSHVYSALETASRSFKDANDDMLLQALRRELALKAFHHTADYDAAIVRFFEFKRETDRVDIPVASRPELQLPSQFELALRQDQQLRYGENPHQQAALYQQADGQPLGGMEQLHGKELSYNNIVDLDAALQLVWEFEQPAATIIKHTNPAGCARADSLENAYIMALQADPVSAFGGIVALNRPVTRALAARMNEHFFEIVAAPDFEPDALEILQQKENIRLIRWKKPAKEQLSLRATALGILVQTPDPLISLATSGLQIPTRRGPTAAELEDLQFAWKICKHVKSNAIVLATKGRSIGVGAGQMSRVDSVELAIKKCASSLTGAVMASDAFFPFRDGIDAAARAGIRAVIQPGGSKRDPEVIAACDANNIAMIFTGQRHFRH